MSDVHIPLHAIKGRGAASLLAHRFSMDERARFDDGWGTVDDAAAPHQGAPPTHVTEKLARSAINRNTSPDVPFSQSVNPYRGCEHGCIYCYARPTHSYLDLSPGLDFETRIVAKVNAAERLQEALASPRYTPMMLCAPGTPRRSTRIFDRTVLDALPEPAASNRLRWSDDPTRAPWTRVGLGPGVGVWPGVRSPIGTNAGARLIESTHVGAHGVVQPFRVERGTAYCASQFILAAGRSACRLAIRWPDGSMTWGAFNLAGGTSDLGNGSSTIRSLGQGWYRIAVSGIAPASGEAEFELLTLPSAEADTAHAGNAALRLVTWGAQVEEGDRPTSYIPTFFLPETRPADPEFTGPSPGSSGR